MKNSWIIAMRELRERIGSRSFVVMALVGPLLVLSLTYLLFAIGENKPQKWKVLIADPRGIMENKIMPGEDKSISYSFASDYIEIADFASGKNYQDFDAMVEVNEKIITNKLSFVFYREKPTLNMTINIRYQVERRLEEILAARFTKLSANDFRKIKQPLQMPFKNAYDPTEQSSDLAGWVGLFFGTVIFVFIFLFGMTILRSVSREKSNRIVEILVSTVHPRALMLGKIVGVGLSAFIQFLLWAVIISVGLYLMRETVFVNGYDPANLAQNTTSVAYNEFVELIFERIQFSSMVGYFLLFFAVGYLFYGAFFAALGAVTGSESDGQQFLLPLIALLLFALYSGYYVLNNPETQLAQLYHYLPFTSPVVVMVKLAVGYPDGQGYQLFLSLLILLVSAFAVLSLAGKLYKNGILQFGHSVRLKQIFQWLKKN
ncbi:MAG TPA: ABC transporter permease [Fluviicola sp.]|nr:ABC transporter permease [Fluviicola sp.]